MNTKEKSRDVAQRIKCADGVVITPEKIIERALTDAFNAGLKRAALYVADEIGADRMAREILHLS